MRHRQTAVPRTVPPVEFDNLGESQIGDQVRHMTRNDDRWSGSADTQIVLHDGPHRRPVQVIEVRVRRAGLRSDALMILKWPTRWMNGASCWLYFSSDYPSKNRNSCGSHLAFSIRALNHRQI